MNEDLLSDFRCATCGGPTQRGHTTHSVDLTIGVIVIRHVPVAICMRCGEEWLDDVTAQAVEALLESAKRRKSQIEVLSFDETMSEMATSA
jgi:YgiT-type zinc finger domain-containing protein